MKENSQPFTVETERLRLLPLTLAQLSLIETDFVALEQCLGLTPASFELNAPPAFMEEFFEAIRSHTVPSVAANPDDYRWFTQWMLIHKTENCLAGGMGMSGLPDAAGEVSIGYFINRTFENKGLASEALAAILQFIFVHPSVSTAVAYTASIDNASVTVLQKNGFNSGGTVEGGYKWFKNKI
ncbi:GNAT family N-acetyltransferase [Terrimonas sp. NA20]|uniref:GNAT family N-acetyltransferase n=1 Tax=Terrimonas ginsenosidimutans TaxID=2908004 RepID=A0ABS9KME0_9BACT|nr:GNAT family N-acetyltransferase [Terrimonas ginsenosidimutans]MCG2613490.1 GNAT family N-acetyltransferase [Terrimonas ginsenosidimutans]